MPVTFPHSDFADTDFNPEVHGQLLQTREGLEFISTRAEPCVAYGPHGFPFEGEAPARSPAPQVPRPRPPGLGAGLLIVCLMLAVFAAVGAASVLVSSIAPGPFR